MHPVHPPARIVCGKCGNRTIGEVVIHGRDCGCPPPGLLERAPDRWWVITVPAVPPEWRPEAARQKYPPDIREGFLFPLPLANYPVLDDDLDGELQCWCARCTQWRRWRKSDLTAIGRRRSVRAY